MQGVPDTVEAFIAERLAKNGLSYRVRYEPSALDELRKYNNGRSWLIDVYTGWAALNAVADLSREELIVLNADDIRNVDTAAATITTKQKIERIWKSVADHLDVLRENRQLGT